MLADHYTRFLSLSLLVLVQAFGAGAQNVVFTANANAAKVGLQDQVEVTYTIRDAENLRTMSPGTFKDFQVVGGPFQSQNSSINISGNRTIQSMSVSLTYILQPRHTGNLSIPPAVAKDDNGHAYQSNAISIQVVPGSLASRQPARQQAYDPWGDDPFGGGDPFAAYRQQLQQAGRAQARPQAAPRQQAPAPVSMSDIYKDLFIKVNVDKSKVRIGEQVTASYKLYARLPMQVGISKLPSLNGFWTQDFDIPKQAPKPTEEIVNGKKYQVFLLKKSALFPQQAGTLTLDPAEAEGTARVIQQVRQQNPFADLFDDPFFQQSAGSLMMNDPFFNNDLFSSLAYKDVPVHLKSTPVHITVLPLPDKDVPADYGGAVGQFSVSAKMDKNQLTTDDAASLIFQINGSGNLKLIQAPKLNLPNGLDTYEPMILDTVTGRSTTISGSKIITYSISPRTPGDYTIPPIPFTYFNPQSGSFVTLHTQPFRLQVRPGKHYQPAVAKTNSSLTDIHGIVLQAPARFDTDRTKPMFFSPVYWSMYALPLLAFIGVAFWRRREEELNANTVLLKRRRANRVALKRLAAARQLLQQGQQKAFYDEVSKAIWLYLSDKLNLPISGLSKVAVTGALTARQIPVALQEKIAAVTEDCELALYAPAGGKQKMQQTYTDAISIISELEEYLQR